jgi:hypothetical protein
MIGHAWSVVCEKTIIDQASNNISLDVMEQILIQGPPLPEETPGILVPAPLSIASLWYREESDKPCRGRAQIKIISPGGDEVASVELDVDLTKAKRSRTICKMNGLPVKKGESGFYRFILELNREGEWHEVANVPLEVELQEVEPKSQDG